MATERHSLFEERTAIHALGGGYPSAEGVGWLTAQDAWRDRLRRQHPEILQRLGVIDDRLRELDSLRRGVEDRQSRYQHPEAGLEHAGVLAEHRAARLEECAPELRATLEGWLDGERPGLLINGPVGTGKTRVAAALMAEVIRAGQRGRLVLARRLLMELWRDTNEGSGCAAMDKLIAVPWLMIDDLGHEGRISEAAVAAFHELLSVRCGEYRRTVITTNLSLDEISKAYDPSIASRIGAWTQVVITGPDRRRDG